MEIQVEEEYREAIRELMKDCDVKRLREFIQHQQVSCLEHSLCVSYMSYRIAKKCNLDAPALARGGLLHDFFLYDWHDKMNRPKELHGPNHPKIALRNAKARFEITDMEADIILKHMWPLTFSMPKYKETWVIILADKICTVAEVCHFARIRSMARVPIKAVAGMIG